MSLTYYGAIEVIVIIISWWQSPVITALFIGVSKNLIFNGRLKVGNAFECQLQV